MKALVKISWQRSPTGWVASLLTTDGDEFTRLPFTTGDEFSYEISTSRRCIGYHDDIGQRYPCPDFTELEAGSRCDRCQKNDIYTQYVRGQAAADTDADYSVYLAQIGDTVKVGVTRSDSLLRRWIEQGAAYGAELQSGITSNQALAEERRISNLGVPERIRKEAKLEPGGDDELRSVIDTLGADTSIQAVAEKTVYPDLDCTQLRREGRAVGSLRAVKGQIFQLDDLCFACTPGRVIHEPSQRGLEEYT